MIIPNIIVYDPAEIDEWCLQYERLWGFMEGDGI